MQCYSLIQAMILISETHGFTTDKFTSIMFEDGSQTKFIHQLNNGRKYYTTIVNGKVTTKEI